MSNILDLAEQFKKKSKAEIQKFAESQHGLLSTSLEKVKQLEIENEHLKNLLASFVPNVSKIIAPSEQELVEIQIQMMKQRGMDRELSFEDTKKLEVLVKTLKIIKDEDKPIKAETKKQITATDAELIAFAQKEEKNGNE